MSIRLSPESEALIREQIARGRFATADDVVHEALRLRDERDQLAHLRAAIAVGDEQIARGEVVDRTPDFVERLMAEADEEDRLDVPIGDDVMPDQRPAVRRLTPEEQRRALAALERAERIQAKILADRGGEPFSPSWELVNDARDERTRHLP